MKDDIIRKQSLANMWMGVGLLLVIVPIGVSLLSILVDPKNPFKEAQMLGWSFYIVIALLPIWGRRVYWSLLLDGPSQKAAWSCSCGG